MRCAAGSGEANSAMPRVSATCGEPRMAGRRRRRAAPRRARACRPSSIEALEPRALERGDVRLLVAARDLDAVRVDEVEVADERGRFGGVGADDRGAARLAAYPGELELLAVVLIQPRDAGLQHTAARRRSAGGGSAASARWRGCCAARGR